MVDVSLVDVRCLNRGDSFGSDRTDIVRRVCEDGCVLLLCRHANTEYF